jgi:hypothetical protein
MGPHYSKLFGYWICFEYVFSYIVYLTTLSGCTPYSTHGKWMKFKYRALAEYYLLIYTEIFGEKLLQMSLCLLKSHNDCLGSEPRYHPSNNRPRTLYIYCILFSSGISLRILIWIFTSSVCNIHKSLCWQTPYKWVSFPSLMYNMN